MGNGRESGLWTRVKEISSFLAAIIAILVAIISAIAWSSGYFATQKQLKIDRCYSQIRYKILDTSIALKIAEDDYIKKNNELNDLVIKQRKDPASFDSDDQLRLRLLEGDIRLLFDGRQKLLDKAESLDKILDLGDILTSSGDCKEN